MVDNSCLKGHGFESQRHILERPKINEKEAGVGPFLKKSFERTLAHTID